MTEHTLTAGTVVRETTVQGTETEYTVKFVRELDGTVSIQVQDKATGKEIGTESLETAVFLKITDEKRQVDEEVQREQQLRDTDRREEEEDRERTRPRPSSSPPYPFDPKAVPTAFWQRLVEKEIGLTRGVVICVMRSKEVHTFMTANMNRVLHTVETDVKIWFGGTRVWVNGTGLSELHHFLLKGESCVLYEGRDEWKLPFKGSAIKSITIDEGE